ncbi:MAG: hypothetical protein GY940_44045, partial [bacterium]|nr:hypothetical protein [bacterium]
TGVKRVVVLLFDFTMSGNKTVQRSKIIAEKIIAEADPDTRFILMGIEPFSGLKYITESIGNNKLLLDRLAEKTSRKLGTAPISEMNVRGGGAGQNGKIGGRMTEEDSSIAAQQKEALNQRIILPFLNSFRTLYFYLNGIQGSKFVYFFSNGIPNSISKNVPSFSLTDRTSDMGRFNYWLKKAADNLNRSGSIFFLINPSGTGHNSDDVTRGADSTPNTVNWNP